MPKRKKASIKKRTIRKKKLIVQKAPELTYIGEGSVAGEYLFAEIPGSVSASSYKEAEEKAKDLINKRDDLNYS